MKSSKNNLTKKVGFPNIHEKKQLTKKREFPNYKKVKANYQKFWEDD